ncbi:ankyrin repeat-containing protein At5g02620-like [Phragmites australis]|uniref:ankyrin repeat-containing protein At5g02620-like n=1 Tax=Phragmites australis TaxID=29695 RepID=UPI002D7972A8|nr:ankyrin repeat-containing protein At5g02620-like [Phragmites australis]
MDSERRMDPVLYKAATQGKVSSLRQLVENDPKILSSTTPQLNMALHLAAQNGHADFAHEVLEKNEELLVARNADGDTPLHLAAKAGTLEVAKELIRHAKAWPHQKSPLIMTNKAGNNPLHEAVRHHRGSVALALLDADPDRGHDLNDRMESPLDMASREGLIHVVQRIINDTWVDQEFLASISLSGTALHQAVLGGHIRIVEILLEKRPGLIDLTDSDGNNALHYAAQKNHPRAVEMLLNKQTELAYKRNNKNLSPLHVAAHYGSTEAIKSLLRHCPDVAEMVDSDGRNAFHASITNGKANALRCLLRHVRPAELLNHVDKNGNTPLHLAAGMSRVYSALLLLKDHRVKPCVRNNDGHTARSLVETKLTTGEMDAYEMYLWKQLKRQESKKCRKEQLPPFASYPSRRATGDKYFERIVETYILVATLIATVTFAATFTMPGGYDQIKGIALHSHKTAFKIFVISNTVAMCSSIVVVFCFIWAWQDPVKFKVDQLLWGHRLTVLACLAMLVSLMTAVYITVAPTSRWPAYVVIAIGTSTPAVVFLILGRELIYVPL